MLCCDALEIEAPFDSGDAPKAILLQSNDDIAASQCDDCGRPAEDWPRGDNCYSFSRPGAMYRAALYCADCMPHSYDEYTGQRVSTFTGEPS